MIGVLDRWSDPKRKNGVNETHIPIPDQHQKQSWGHLGFSAAEMCWTLVA
jgi:hypothetical protein